MLLPVAGISALVLGIVLAILLFKSDDNSHSNLFLGLLILAYAFWVFELSAYGNWIVRFPHVSFTAAPVVFLFGPLLLFYIQEKNQVKWRDLLHFIPFIISFALLVPFYLNSAEEKRRILTHIYMTPDGKDLHFLLRNMLRTVHLWFYISLSLIAFQQKNQVVSNEKWGFSKAKIQLTIIIAFAVAGLKFIVFALEDYHLVAPRIHLYSFLYLPYITVLILLSCGFLVFFGKRRIEKYKSSSLTEKEANTYLISLQNLMRAEKPFLDSDLKLNDLAEQLDIKPHHLSQIINENLGVNFREFLNQYRIEEAKQRLMNPDFAHYSVLGIAYSAGFKSKSSFNYAFKKYTGVTPTHFRNQHLSKI